MNYQIKKDRLLMTTTVDQKQLKMAMLRALFAKKERGQIADIIRRYSNVCDDLSMLLLINLDFKEMGKVSTSWLESPKSLYEQKERLIMNFWRSMLQWMLRKAHKFLHEAESRS